MRPFRHLVFFRFKASASEQQVGQATFALSALSSVVPGALFYGVYPLAERVTLSDSRGFTVLLDSVYSDAAALSAHHAHPDSASALAQLQPLLDERLVFDYLPEPREGFSVHEFSRLQRPPYSRRIVLYTAQGQQQQEDITKHCYALHDGGAISELLRTVVGRKADDRQIGEQSAEGGRSLRSIVEWVLTDGEGVQRFVAHPEYRRLHSECPALTAADALTFDYDMH